MDIKRAKELIAVLADGVNPITGEVLKADDSCNQPEIIRALFCLLDDAGREQKKEKALPENAGKPWTQKDDILLFDMLEAGAKIDEMCRRFNRTRGAIKSRIAHKEEVMYGRKKQQKG